MIFVDRCVYRHSDGSQFDQTIVSANTRGNGMTLVQYRVTSKISLFFDDRRLG